MPSRSGGDPPQQQVLEIVDRLPPKGLVAVTALKVAGVRDAADVARKLKGAGLDLAPSAEGPSRRRAPTLKVESKSGGAAPAAGPIYTDEFKGGATAGPIRIEFSRTTTGPTPVPRFGLVDAIGDVARRYHLMKLGWALLGFLLGWLGLHGPANKGEALPPPAPAPWSIEIKPG